MQSTLFQLVAGRGEHEVASVRGQKTQGILDGPWCGWKVLFPLGGKNSGEDPEFDRTSLGNLEEMDRFLQRYNLPMKQEEIENMNRPITSTEIETMIKNLPKKQKSRTR